MRNCLLALILGMAATLPALAEPGPVPGAGASASTGEPGAWRSQKTELVYMGFTSHYSCDGLQEKLELLLRQLGARRDFKVVAYGCDRGFGTPSRFPRATLEFATLQPAAGDGTDTAAPAEPPVTGVWHTVELSPRHPFDLQDGDCELMEQFRDKILPFFATRDLQVQATCVPHQDNGPFSLQMQVFAPLAPPKSK